MEKSFYMAERKQARPIGQLRLGSVTMVGERNMEHEMLAFSKSINRRSINNISDYLLDLREKKRIYGYDSDGARTHNPIYNPNI